MAKIKGEQPSSELATAEETEAERHLKQAILSGKHWYIALLEAIRLWNLPEETHDGHTYHYLIYDEAIDWLVIAERLCEAVKNLIPEEEKANLLFHGEPPLNLTPQDFKELIGPAKYHQYLNYFYGVTVEEALMLAVEEEIQKERRSAGLTRDTDAIANEAYRRIYSATKAILLRNFRKEKRYSYLKSATLSELKQFTYWLFKYRLKHNDKAKIASDTKKALIWLNKQSLARHLSKHDFNQEFIEITG